MDIVKETERGYFYSGPERRKFKRIKRPFMAKFRLGADESYENMDIGWNMVTVRNLSAEGALFNFDRMIKQGTKIDMQIIFPLSRGPISCMGNVNRVEQGAAPNISYYAICFADIDDNDRKLINDMAEAFAARRPDKLEQ